MLRSIITTFGGLIFSLGIIQSSLAEEPKTQAERLPRVLLIGDSISIGYTKPVIELLKGKAEVQRVKGNAGHTGMGLEKLPKWLDEKHGQWDVIHFNWG
ncbi:MAG: hypothetical protein KDA84_18280, partial [Planctomycetaceae bacterium]|nr:hypothetical protein [Planctomycetaceae bacterium]